MGAPPETITYVLIFNESDFSRQGESDYKETLYVHGLTDIVLLALLVIVSFLCNIAVIITVASHYYLRKLPFYVLLLAISCIFLFDCIFNGSVSLVYMSQISWQMGELTCQTNVFVIQLVMAVVPWLIVQAAVDRYVCLHHPVIYRQHFTATWQVAAIGLILVLTTIAGVPYLIGFLSVQAFPARMACGAANIITSHRAFIYVTVLIILETGIPSLAIFAFCVFFVHALISSRHQKQRIQASSWLRTENMLSSTTKPTLSHHDTKTLYLWLVMSGYYTGAILPYAILSIVQQLSESDTEVDTRQHEMCRTPQTDAFLTWLRYLATSVHPIAVLSLHDDIRQETRTLLTAWKSSTVMSDTEILPTANNNSVHSKWNASMLVQKCKGERTSQADDLTAVLFPSSNGLFLRHPIGTSASQFEYNICDNFSECCSDEKRVSAEMQNGKAIKVISEKEYEEMKLRTSRKYHSRSLPSHSDLKPVGRARQWPKYQNSKTVPKNVKKLHMPVKNGQKKMTEFSKKNGSAIIQAELINTQISRDRKKDKFL